MFAFLTEKSDSEDIVQQTELLGYLFKLLVPHQVSWYYYSKQSVYQQYIYQLLGEECVFLAATQIVHLVC